MVKVFTLGLILMASPAAANVSQMVATQTEQRLGLQWVPAALKIAKLESGFRCDAVGPHTKHGRARGVFQVMPASARALGHDPARLHECAHGISAGIAHMALCIKSGVRTDSQMASCHLRGIAGWRSRGAAATPKRRA